MSYADTIWYFGNDQSTALGGTGIYRIVNVVNMKMYIGSAAGKQGFGGRWRIHRFDLLRGSGSPRLQNAFNKYGEASFKFEILCVCRPQEAIRYEQVFLDIFESWRPETGYNIAKIAGSRLGVPHTEETKRKLSMYKGRQSRLGQAVSVESRQKMSVSHLGKQPRLGQTQSDATKKKISEKMKGRVSNRKGATVSAESRARMSAAQTTRQNKKRDCVI